MTIATAGGGADGDEYGFRCFDTLDEVAGERQAPGRHVFIHQFFKPRLKDGHAAGVQGGEFGGVGFDHGHLGAEFGEAGAGYEAHIAAAYHGNAHVKSSFLGAAQVKHRCAAGFQKMLINFPCMLGGGGLPHGCTAEPRPAAPVIDPPAGGAGY